MNLQLLSTLYVLCGQVNIERLPNNLYQYDDLPEVVQFRLLYTRPLAYDADGESNLYYKTTGRFPFWKGRTKVQFKGKIFYHMWNANKYSEPWVFHMKKLYLIERGASALTFGVRDREAAKKLYVRVFNLKSTI